jgi:hypothetical protein
MKVSESWLGDVWLFSERQTTDTTSLNLASEVPPRSPDGNAQVTYIAGPVEQFFDLVEHFSKLLVYALHQVTPGISSPEPKVSPSARKCQREPRRG